MGGKENMAVRVDRYRSSSLGTEQRYYTLKPNLEQTRTFRP